MAASWKNMTFRKYTYPVYTQNSYSFTDSFIDYIIPAYLVYLVDESFVGCSLC